MNSELCILLVDDIPENIKIMRASLADLGCKILIANGGYRAIEIATTALPDLILLDVMMLDPINMDGIDLLEAIDKRRAYRRKDGEWDMERTAMALLTDYRSGAIDRVSLESPASTSEMITTALLHQSKQFEENETITDM